MGEYSPAPWKIIYAGLDDMTEAQRIEEEMPVVAVGPINYTEFSEAGSKRERANAHLIAASLELYEAAVYLLAHEDTDPDDNLDQDTYTEAWEFLKEAVAKAEGKA